MRPIQLPRQVCFVQDKASLQNRLETAINNAEGFGLR